MPLLEFFFSKGVLGIDAILMRLMKEDFVFKCRKGSFLLIKLLPKGLVN